MSEDKNMGNIYSSMKDFQKWIYLFVLCPKMYSSVLMLKDEYS